MKPLHDDVAKIISRGFISERDRMHGGGYRVLWEGATLAVCQDRDEAEDILLKARTDAMFGLIDNMAIGGDV
jgi:hypothetical protein